MFKKIITLFLISLLLLSCTTKKETLTNDESSIVEDDINDTEEIIEIIQEDNDYSLWSYVGEGEYSSNLSYKTIRISGANEQLISPDIYLESGLDYNISFSIASIKDTRINFKIVSGDNIYIDEDIEIDETFKECSFSFKTLIEDYQAKATFIIDDDQDNVINIDDFSLSSNTNKRTIKINQIGYLSKLNKRMVTSQNQGDYFNIYNADNELVYSAKLSKVVYEYDSNEYLQYGDFNNFKNEGIYYIKTELGAYSENFKIADDVYDALAGSALNFIYNQRCGMAIEDEEVYHEACHTNDTKIFPYLGDYYIDTTGGWHDAGDYGRYVQTSTKTMADLLFAYLYSGDKDKTILAEARYGIEWLLKLQTGDGSVYNKVTTKIFAGSILPENDKAERYAMWPWTLTTASFAGITGLAYLIYQDSDPDFAEKCLNAQQKALNYLINNKEAIQELNPDDFSTGEYRDPNENDERLFAYAVAYSISKEKSHYQLCKEIIDEALASNDKNYNMRIYGLITLLNCLTEDDGLYQKAKDSLISECDSLVENINNNVYGYSYDAYNWGSNSHLCDACNKLLLAYQLFGEKAYLEKASVAINYVMGLNCLDLCFIYGYGYHYPKTVHHRVANIHNTLPTGALVGGVDQYLSEGVVGNYLSEETPIAKRFVDTSESYTNVEPAIYYNSPLVLTLKLLTELNQDN